MLQVRQDLCHGCELCVDSCTRQAISMRSGRARIDQNRCNNCGLCLDACPRGAIIELVPVSRRELKANVTGLKSKAEDIIARIERLKNNGN